jgi:N-acetylglucosamine kinase-like BadF-type ATPase
VVSARLGLGLESGGTGTRWCLANADGATIGEGIVAPVNGHIFTEADRQRAAAVVAALRAAVMPLGRPSAILAGITGFGHSRGSADALRGMLATAFGIDPAAIGLSDDMWLTYRTVFEPGEGIVVSAGTGCFAYHLSRDGAAIRAGGYGIIVDDAGGGAWIGKQALRAIMRLEDEQPGQGWSTALGRRIAAIVGGAAWDSARGFVYGGDRGSLGSLAPAVAEAAAEGDTTAAGLFSEAGAELARLGNALRRRVGMKPIALVGRAAYLDRRVADAFLREVEAPVHLHPAQENAAAVAARLALAPQVPAQAGTQ